MEEMIIRIENIRGLSFGAAMIDEDSYDDFEDVKEFPFDYTTSTVCGPNHYWSEDNAFEIAVDGADVKQISVSDIPAFSTNKEIDKSGFFTSEQATYIKKLAKNNINSYYKSWRSGQSFGNGEGELLEVHEEGKGEMIASLESGDNFDETRLFLLLADTLPHKETVIASVGYINSDGTISCSDFEYGDYRFTFTDISIAGESIDL